MSDKIINALFIGPDIFFPENKNGVNKTTYNILKDNSKLHVNFLYPSYGDGLPEDLTNFSNVKFIPIESALPKKKGLIQKIFSLFSPTPFLVANDHTIEALKPKMLEHMESTDIIQIFSLALVPLLKFIPQNLKHKVVICAIDSLSFFYESRVSNERNLFKKLIWKIELYKAKKLEQKYYNLAAKILFVSQRDEEYARNQFTTSAIFKGLYYGVDTDHFDSMEEQTQVHTEDSLIFTGNFNYGPNSDAADFLLEQVMPKVWKKKPKMKLYLAGGHPSKKLLSINDDRIIVTGFVDSLVPYIKKSKIFLSPIFFGAGVKTKVLEAMYLEKIVLGTPQSFNAIDSQDRKDCLEVNNCQDGSSWSKMIIDIFDNYETYQSIEVEAKKSILRSHNWKNVKLSYVNEYRKLL